MHSLEHPQRGQDQNSLPWSTMEVFCAVTRTEHDVELSSNERLQCQYLSCSELLTSTNAAFVALFVVCSTEGLNSCSHSIFCATSETGAS